MPLDSIEEERVAEFTVTEFPDRAPMTLRETRMTLTNLAECIKSATAPSKEQLPWLKLARFNGVINPRPAKKGHGCLRYNGAVEAVSGLEGDYDGEKVPMPDAAELVRKAGIEALFYTSASHTPAKPRWRVLCPFSTTHPPAERTAYMDQLNGVLGGILHPESWTLAQAFYFGSVAGKHPVEIELVPGVHLDQCVGLEPIGKGKAERGTSTETHDRREAPEGLIESDDDYQLLRAGRDYIAWYLAKRACSFSATGVGAYIVANKLIDMRTTPALSILSDAAVTKLLNEAGWPSTEEWIAEKREDRLNGSGNAPGCDIVGYPTDWPGKAEAEQKADGFDPSIWLSGTALARGDFPPPEYVWDKFILKHNVNLLYGDGKAGKTMLAVHIGVAAAAGVNLFNHTVTGPAPVLMVLAEDTAGAIKRSAEAICRSLNINLEGLPITFVCKPGIDLTLADIDDKGNITLAPFYHTLDAAIARFAPGGVIFLDAAVDFAILNENLRAPVTKFCRNVLDQLGSKHKATIVLNAHPSKAGVRDGSGTSGSTAWRNAVRNMLSFSRVTKDKNDTRRILEVGAGSYGDTGRLALTMNGPVLSLGHAREANPAPSINELKLQQIVVQHAIKWAAEDKPIRLTMPPKDIDTKGKPVFPTRLAKGYGFFVEGVVAEMGMDVPEGRIVEALRKLEAGFFLRYQKGVPGSRAAAGYYPGTSRWTTLEDEIAA